MVEEVPKDFEVKTLDEYVALQMEEMSWYSRLMFTLERYFWLTMFIASTASYLAGSVYGLPQEWQDMLIW